MISPAQHVGKLVSVALFAFALAGCGEDDPVAGELIGKEAFAVSGAPNVGTSESFVYRMPAVGGGLADARAVILIPAGAAPSGGWPLLAWGHGTTGIADTCAPSTDGTLAGYAGFLDALVGAGYAVVAPDYEGLGADGLHPYLSLQSEGRSLLYAAKAAADAYASVSSRVGLIGHSQGGHAVLGAAELAGEVPSLDIVGTVAFAPASNVRASGDQLQAVIANPAAPIGDRVGAGVSRLAFSTLILAAIPATTPTFDIASAFGPDGAFLASAAVTTCLSALVNQITPVVQTAVVNTGSIESLLPSSTLDIPAVSSYLQAMEPGTRTLADPVLLLQGGADTTVFPAFTQQLRDTMVNRGTSVTYTEIANESHTSIVQAGAAAALSFLGTMFASP